MIRPTFGVHVATDERFVKISTRAPSAHQMPSSLGGKSKHAKVRFAYCDSCAHDVQKIVYRLALA
jgi:hypothetical protein